MAPFFLAIIVLLQCVVDTTPLPKCADHEGIICAKYNKHWMSPLAVEVPDEFAWMCGTTNDAKCKEYPWFKIVPTEQILFVGDVQLTRVPLGKSDVARNSITHICIIDRLNDYYVFDYDAFGNDITAQRVCDENRENTLKPMEMRSPTASHHVIDKGLYKLLGQFSMHKICTPNVEGREYIAWKQNFDKLRVLDTARNKWMISWQVNNNGRLPTWDTCPGITYDMNIEDYRNVHFPIFTFFDDARNIEQLKTPANQNKFVRLWNRLLRKKNDIPHGDFVWVDVPVVSCALQQNAVNIQSNYLIQADYNEIYEAAKAAIRDFPKAFAEACGYPDVSARIRESPFEPLPLSEQESHAASLLPDIVYDNYDNYYLYNICSNLVIVLDIILIICLIGLICVLLSVCCIGVGYMLGRYENDIEIIDKKELNRV